MADRSADQVYLAAAQGAAVREFVLKLPLGRADYVLFADCQGGKTIS